MSSQYRSVVMANAAICHKIKIRFASKSSLKSQSCVLNSPVPKEPIICAWILLQLLKAKCNIIGLATVGPKEVKCS